MEEDPPVVRASCDHCGCAQAAHRNGRDECESCSCIAFLGPDGLPLPAVPDDPGNLDTRSKFIAAGVKDGDRLEVTHQLKGVSAIRQTYRYAPWGRTPGSMIRVARESDGSTIWLEWGDILECRRLEPTETVEARPANLDDHEAFVAAAVKPGAKLHLAVVGNHVTDEAVFVRMLSGRWPNYPNASHFAPPPSGIVVRIDGREIDLPWGDLIECWPVPEPPDPRYADGRPPAETTEAT